MKYMNKFEEKYAFKKEEQEYESLKNSKFKQQKLPGWRPVPSMMRTVVIFFGIGILFVGLGILILLFSNEIVDDKKEYCVGNPSAETCEIEFKINKTMKPNIMIYYEIDGFYQNHRRYMKSKSDKQLKGEEITEKEAEDCAPVITNQQMGKAGIKSISGEILKENDIAIPCGLMAKSFFNDAFEFFLNDNKEKIMVNETNIARKSDREKYKNVNPSRQWMNLEDEHFMVWMRPAPLPNFRKLWGRIESQIEAGSNITVKIKNNYNVSLLFSPLAKKYIILTTVNCFGGKNTFLIIGCFILGEVSIILGIIFFIEFKMRAKKEK